MIEVIAFAAGVFLGVGLTCFVARISHLFFARPSKGRRLDGSDE